MNMIGTCLCRGMTPCYLCEAEQYEKIKRWKFLNLLHNRAYGNTIVKTEDVCFGRARIKNTRLAVWFLVMLRTCDKSNWKIQVIIEEYGINQEQLNSAWAYYELNKDEIDSILAKGKLKTIKDIKN